MVDQAKRLIIKKFFLYSSFILVSTVVCQAHNAQGTRQEDTLDTIWIHQGVSVFSSSQDESCVSLFMSVSMCGFLWVLWFLHTAPKQANKNWSLTVFETDWCADETVSAALLGCSLSFRHHSVSLINTNFRKCLLNFNFSSTLVIYVQHVPKNKSDILI